HLHADVPPVVVGGDDGGDHLRRRTGDLLQEVHGASGRLLGADPAVAAPVAALVAALFGALVATVVGQSTPHCRPSPSTGLPSPAGRRGPAAPARRCAPA